MRLTWYSLMRHALAHQRWLIVAASILISRTSCHVSVARGLSSPAFQVGFLGLRGWR